MRKLFVLFAGFALLSLRGSAQELNSVKGKITDPEGKPLAGAVVWAAGANVKATTDTAGNFTLVLAASIRTLQCSFPGFSMQQVQVTGDAALNICLKPEEQSLSEIVFQASGSSRSAASKTKPARKAGANARPAGSAGE
ncbi:MAG TPA: carboxypeptidase-like regulatory domain-containing protein [Chitinophagaceae bacterium]